MRLQSFYMHNDSDIRPGPARFVVFPVGLKGWIDVDLHMRYAEYASSVRLLCTR